MGREIRDENARLVERLADWESRLSEEMPSDYKDWHQNSKEEWPTVAALTIRNLRAEVQRLTAELAATAMRATAAWIAEIEAQRADALELLDSCAPASVETPPPEDSGEQVVGWICLVWDSAPLWIIQVVTDYDGQSPYPYKTGPYYAEWRHARPCFRLTPEQAATLPAGHPWRCGR